MHLYNQWIKESANKSTTLLPLPQMLHLYGFMLIFHISSLPLFTFSISFHQPYFIHLSQFIYFSSSVSLSFHPFICLLFANISLVFSSVFLYLHTLHLSLSLLFSLFLFPTPNVSPLPHQNSLHCINFGGTRQMFILWDIFYHFHAGVEELPSSLRNHRSTIFLFLSPPDPLCHSNLSDLTSIHLLFLRAFDIFSSIRVTLHQLINLYLSLPILSPV